MDLNKPEPLDLDGDVAANFSIFKEEVLNFFVATSTDKKPREVQVARLKNLMGSEALKLYNALKNEENQVKETVRGILLVLEAYCTPKKNVTMRIFKFLTRRQKESEPFEKFYADLKKLVKSCEFGNQEEKLLRAQITLGITSKEAQEKLLRCDRSLEEVVDLCKALEVSERNLKEIQRKAREVDVDEVKKKTAGHIGNQVRQTPFNGTRGRFGVSGTESSVGRMCSRCGGKHTMMARCPAIGRMCTYCKRPNHFAGVCVFKRDDGNRPQRKCDVVEGKGEPCVDDVGSGDESVVCIDSVEAAKQNKTWFKLVKIHDTQINFKLDTGAEVDILPYSYVSKYNWQHKIKEINTKLVAFGGFRIETMGYIDAVAKTDNEQTPVKLIIVNSKGTPILGLDSCVKLKLIERLDILGTTEGIDEKMNIFNNNKDVFEGLGCFPDQCSIKLVSHAVPYASSARRIPFKIRDRFKDTLNQLVDKQIIEPVSEPSDWVNNVVIVEKPDHSLRICIDPLELNKCIVRERLTIPTLEELAPTLAYKSYYSVLDIKDGYYHVKLDNQSSRLCTFSTIFGTYRFLRAPFGLSNMPELFQRLVYKYFGDINGLAIYFDDLCIAADSKEEHDNILQTVLKRARKYNIKFNFKKFQYCVPQVTYVGVIFCKQGMLPDPEKINVIKNFRNPSNRTELQRMFGMINYLRSFIPNLSELLSPLRSLLKQETEFQWLEHHSKALDKVKTVLCSPQVLAPFDPKLPIEIQCDASSGAIGSCLLQNKRPVCFASRYMTDTETNYAQVEKELLAVVYSCNKFHNYIYGHTDIVVKTDHMPLVSIMTKMINQIKNNRIKRLKLKLMVYNIKVEYLPGKKMYIADFLSRCEFEPKLSDDDGLLEESMRDVVHCVHSEAELSFSEDKLKLFQDETSADDDLSRVIEFYKNGWPNRLTAAGEIMHFYKIKNDLAVENGLVYYNKRLLVPSNLRKYIMQLLHETHLGYNKINKTVNAHFYWPGINSDIKELVLSCRICQKFQRSKIKEPLMSHEMPTRPFQKIGSDIAHFKGSKYLVIIDYFSRWIEVFKLNNTYSKIIIEKFIETFSRFGIPETLVADNMPFNSYEMKEFARKWNFKITTCSPYHHRSNGLAEKGVGIVKKMLQKAEDEKQLLNLYLLNYRSSAVAGLDQSPSELLNSRKMRTKLPVRQEFLEPKLAPPNIVQQMADLKEEQKSVYNRGAKKKEDNFEEGDRVLVQDVFTRIWKEGSIERKLGEPRSYLVRVGNKVYRRNSIHIRVNKTRALSA